MSAEQLLSCCFAGTQQRYTVRSAVINQANWYLRFREVLQEIRDGLDRDDLCYADI
jgi:hypothetical protein